MDVAHEVRLAKEAEAEMELHVAKAGEKVEKEAAKHATMQPNASGTNMADHGAMSTGNRSLDDPAGASPTTNTAEMNTTQAPPVKKFL
jgi:hypothetical protein